ncbi:DUF992 domain-containing protein [Bradyrhizobium sp. LHD-71]|uniref:DUF992 domain-containing protein n=1 Tax=Bradyrhizobium sp. LHD-71 TaxID=3072141 RepID=UPI00280E480E|nr:DUF992 domain-containing protein [Bradyrhizobium sp. LHD-71]MDQ8729079.1 DUF992 domain-containing protein [Bradyrhizobium sp. LHD-71]
MHRFRMGFGAAAAMLAVTIVPATAQQPTALIGVLECTGGRSAGYLVGSVTELNCMLTRNGRRVEPYVAQVRRIGFDVGFTDRWMMAWEVYGPTPRVPPGGTSGGYGGAGASATVGVGAALNQLIGGPGGSLSLIPLGVNGQRGVNLAFGFEGMEIRPARY